MKIVFCGVGETHYYSLLINRMVSDYSWKIYNVIPRKGSGHLGQAVGGFSGKKLFNTIALTDLKLLKSNHVFVGLLKQIIIIRPDVLVLSEEYLYSIMLNPFMVVVLRILGVKVYLKSIPFRLPLAKDYIGMNRKLIGFVKFYIRSFLYRKLDGHLVYINKGKEIYKSYGVDLSKIFVTYNSPDTDLLINIYKKLNTEMVKSKKTASRIVHVGRLIPWKKVDLLIAACEEVRKRGFEIELFIIGDGPERNNLENLSKKFEKLKTSFLGGIHNAELLGRELVKSDLYVLAGIGGLSINDAMCFALPVVCSECDGTEVELVKNGYNGFIFQNDSIEDLVNKIILVLEDEEKRKKMGLASLEIIEKKINIKTVLNEFNNAFSGKH